MSEPIEPFFASNGVMVWDRGTSLVAQEAAAFYGSIPAKVADGLAEFFQEKRDTELGRWRWTEGPDYIFYPEERTDTSADCVRIIRESDGSTGSWSRDEAHLTEPPDFSAAARAYFNAHPEPKPWHPGPWAGCGHALTGAELLGETVWGRCGLAKEHEGGHRYFIGADTGTSIRMDRVLSGDLIWDDDGIRLASTTTEVQS